MPGCFKAKDGHGVALVHGPCPCLCVGLLCVFNCMHTAVLNDAIASGELDSCDLGVFRSHCFLLLLPRSIFNKHSQITKKTSYMPTSVSVCFLFRRRLVPRRYRNGSRPRWPHTGLVSNFVALAHGCIGKVAFAC